MPSQRKRCWKRRSRTSQKRGCRGPRSLSDGRSTGANGSDWAKRWVLPTRSSIVEVRESGPGA